MGYYESDMLAKQQAGMMNSPQVRNHDIVPNLKAQRQELSKRIEKIDKLLGLLEQNPHFVQMLDLTRELI